MTEPHDEPHDEPLLDEEELAGHELDEQLEHFDTPARYGSDGELTVDPQRAAAMLADAEQDPEVAT